MTLQALLWTAVLGALLLFDPQVAEGMVTETTAFNRPPFSFACGVQLGGGGTPTFCGGQGDKKYVKVHSADIYRDDSNKVGDCLNPEKEYIKVILNEWFNYDCKIPNVERDVEYKEMPIAMLKAAMTDYCSIPSARVFRIVVEYDCVRTLNAGPPPTLAEDRNGFLKIPPRLSVVTGNVGESTARTTNLSMPSTTTTGKLSISITAAKENYTAPTPSSDSRDGVIETTVHNQPQLSFACNPKLGGGPSTFCGATGDATYMSIDNVEIYRDYSSKVGFCLEPEKEYVRKILHDWFNYDCKMPVVARGGEFKRMPVDMLKVAMNAHCGIALADVYKIAVHYHCVKTNVAASERQHSRNA